MYTFYKERAVRYLFLCGAISMMNFLWADDPAIYMAGRLPLQNGRYQTFYEALRLMSERNVKIIVEAGTARCGDTNFDGDGGSTVLFAHWAYVHGATFYSVDINEKHIEIAQAVVIPYRTHIRFVLSDSVRFLHDFDQQIDFLYLDSWDYDEKNPGPAQQHNLREVQAVYDKLTDNSIIMIDDCNIPGGGKGKLALQWLEGRGWYRHRNKHQVILLKKK